MIAHSDLAAPGPPAPVTEGFVGAAAHIAGDRRRALALGMPMPDRVHGAALFADISGFTPLTETLAKELGSQRGAEAIAANLNRVFRALIDELDRFGGHVVYFNGDAITCWIDGDDGLRATACGLAMQRAMGRLAEVVTPAGTRVALAMKIVVAAGTARRFVVGDPEIQLLDILAGRVIAALADTEAQSRKGEVVAEQSTVDALRGRVEIAASRRDPESGCAYGVVARMLEDVAAVVAARPNEPLRPCQGAFECGTRRYSTRR